METETLKLGTPTDKEGVIDQLVNHFNIPPDIAAAKMAFYLQHSRHGNFYRYVLKESEVRSGAMELVGQNRDCEVRLAIIQGSPLQNSFVIEPALQDLAEKEASPLDTTMQVMLQNALTYGNEDSFAYSNTNQKGERRDFHVIVKHDILDGTFTVYFCSPDVTEKYFELAFDPDGKMIDAIDFENGIVQGKPLNSLKNGMPAMQALSMAALYEHFSRTGRITSIISNVRYGIENSRLAESIRNAATPLFRPGVASQDEDSNPVVRGILKAADMLQWLARF